MNFLLFLGTVRDSTPPKPARLGLRVAKACIACFNSRFDDHQLELIDPLDYPLPHIFKPQFAYPQGMAPSALNALAEKIKSADGFIMLSPEYNHSMSPALANLLNHFGSSLFAYKPSAIATYSAGQWGGMRAAVGMRTFLGELGCLPVSAMIHVANAQQVFNPDGSVQTDQQQSAWFDYFSRTFKQLEWWAQAAHGQKQQIDPHTIMKNFSVSPAQRNSP